MSELRPSSSPPSCGPCRTHSTCWRSVEHRSLRSFGRRAETGLRLIVHAVHLAHYTETIIFRTHIMSYTKHFNPKHFNRVFFSSKLYLPTISGYKLMYEFGQSQSKLPVKRASFPDRPQSRNFAILFCSGVTVWFCESLGLREGALKKISANTLLHATAQRARLPSRTWLQNSSLGGESLSGISGECPIRSLDLWFHQH